MTDMIPFQIEAERVIELLARQIYQSPLALLRENVQNAFDAVRQRIHLGQSFQPKIDIRIEADRISVYDNGIGMTSAQLREHYWTAGSSSKNNQAARAAGVVGTFGVGAMANFGIAERLIVETESASTGERTKCIAEKSKLSLKNDCIESHSLPTQSDPGTLIIAEISKAALISVEKAKKYIAEFVVLLDVPVYLNGELISQQPIERVVPSMSAAIRHSEPSARVGERLVADIELLISNNADVRFTLSKIIWSGRKVAGRLVLRSGQSALKTYRSGFGLATASVNSAFQFGGIADMLNLEPTAGREAITVEGIQLLQAIIVEIDAYVAIHLSSVEECDVSTPFMNWVVSHGRYDLCGKLKMAISPGDRISLAEASRKSELKPYLLYDGADQAVIKIHASDDTPLLILSRSNPRRKCEQGYLRKSVRTTPVSNEPVVKNVRTRLDLSEGESGLAYRIEALLESDYFLPCEVCFGDISHDLPVLALKRQDTVRVVLNPNGQTVKLLIGLYQTDFEVFGGMAKDFVRSMIFPRVADYVPSSTRQGAEAFLKAIRRPRELFEYADNDLGNLPSIWEDYNEGRISLSVAVEKSKAAARSSVQIVENAANISEVIPDVIQNEQVLQEEELRNLPSTLDPSPAITRLDSETFAKLLTIAENDPPLRGYRCFLAITDKVREEMGEFFLQPHRTSVVWGGQKTLFIFIHHSGQFGLYYDLQTREPVDAPSGGGAFATATIVLKDKIFIPIPDDIKSSFVPATGERKRFEVRADIIRTDKE